MDNQYKLLAFLFIGFFISGINIHSVFAQAETDEWIQVYFNMPADEAVALPGNKSNSNWDLIGTLEKRINAATTSIDLCIYDIEHPRIAHALAEAADRGVRVRLITDDHNRTDGGELDLKVWKILARAGITSMDDDGDIYTPDGQIVDNDLVNNSSDMHNKFGIFDYLSPSTSDDYVWTGSTNLTYTGAFNTNHTIIIKDTEVARVYTEEFEQMWGDDDASPNHTQAAFHKDKINVSQNIFDVGGTKLEIYFAPVNRERTKPSVSERIVELMKQEAQHDINFQAFAITPDIPISQQMWALSDNDIQLRGIIDPMFYNRYQNANQIWGSDSAQTGNRTVLPANELRKLHHKVILLDTEHPDSADIGVTVAGSYNFSMNAEMNNDENTLIIYSDEITNQFYQDFMGTLNRAREISYPPAPPIEMDKWYNIYAIRDGSLFEIEVAPGFGYGVRFLGLNVPSIYAGEDSSDYYSGIAADFLQNLLEGRRVRLKGINGNKPEARYNAFQAYVEMEYDNGATLSLNKHLLEKGYATVSDYYQQHPDSVSAFITYQQEAKTKEAGLWRAPEKIGTAVLRAEATDTGNPASVIYPININTADAATLQLLPGIGPAYSKRIVTYRENQGAFKSVDDITNVKGIGPKTLQKLRPITTVE